MSILGLQPNKPKANLEDYVFLVLGVPKSGKTSLLYHIAKKKFNGDLSKLLLLACEKGYNALSGVFAKDINSFEDVVDTVDELIEHKDEVPFRMIGIDTVDILWAYAEEHVIKKQGIADKKRYKTISDIAWGQGFSLVAKEVSAQVQRLVKAGFGLFLITHTKEKKFETRSGVSYDKYTTTLTGKARELFVGIADFVLFLDVTKEKEGENLVDKRYIYFRSDGTIEAGSRFADVPEKIEYDAELFLETFESAVLSVYDGDSKAMNKAMKEQQKEKEENVAEYIESQKSVTIEDVIKELDTLIPELSDEAKVEAKKHFKEVFGTINYRKADDLELLQQALEFVKKLT